MVLLGVLAAALLLDSATALAAPIFMALAKRGQLGCDVWLVHLTGEEFPADCLGARALTQKLVEGWNLTECLESNRREKVFEAWACDEATAVPALVADLVALGVQVHAVKPARISLEEKLLSVLRHEHDHEEEPS